jgi:phospholipid/cholesterol/gamma-HCH transport system substrate-binding protein
MNAAKENFLFRGYYKRKLKEAEKMKIDSAEKRSESIKAIDKKKK